MYIGNERFSRIRTKASAAAIIDVDVGLKEFACWRLDMLGLYKALLQFSGTPASYQSRTQIQGDLSFENTFRNRDCDVASGVAFQFFATNVL